MTKLIRTLIIDDERYAREELIYLLEKMPGIDITGQAENGEAAILAAIHQQPDVVFLDVEMPNMNGIEVAKALLNLKKVPMIIFATAYPQFAAEAFRINAVDYLLKPYEVDQIEQAMERVLRTLGWETQKEQTIKPKKLSIEKDGQFEYVPMEDILYVYPEGKICHVVTYDGEYEVKSTMKELESRLADFHFFRIHRSYLVNLDYVVRLTPWFNGAYELELKNMKDKLPVSRNYAKKLQYQLSL